MNKYFKNYESFTNSNIPKILICENNNYVIIENSFYNKGVYIGELNYNYNSETKKLDLSINENLWDTTKDVASSAWETTKNVGEFAWNMVKTPELTGDLWQDTINWGHWLFTMGSLTTVICSLIFTGGSTAIVAKSIDFLDLGLSGFETGYLFNSNKMMEAGISAFVFIIGGAMILIPGSSGIAKAINSKIKSVAKGLWNISGGVIWKFIQLLIEKFPQYGKLFKTGLKEMPTVLSKCKGLIENALISLKNTKSKIPTSISEKLIKIFTFFKDKLLYIGDLFKNKLNIGLVDEVAKVSLTRSKTLIKEIDLEIFKKLNTMDKEFLEKFLPHLDDITNDKTYLKSIMKDNDFIENLVKKQGLLKDEKTIKIFAKISEKQNIRNVVTNLDDKTFTNILNKIDVDGKLIDVLDKFSADDMSYAIKILSNTNGVSTQTMKKIIETNNDILKDVIIKNNGDLFKSLFNLKEGIPRNILFDSIDDGCDIYIKKNILKYTKDELINIAKKIGIDETKSNLKSGIILYKGNVIRSVKELENLINDEIVLNNMTIVRNSPILFNNFKNYLNKKLNNETTNEEGSITFVENPEAPISNEIITELDLQKIEKIENVANKIRTDEQKKVILDYCKYINDSYKFTNPTIIQSLKSIKDKENNGIEQDETKYLFDKYENIKPFIKLFQAYINNIVKPTEPLVIDGVIGSKTLQSAVDLFTTKMPRKGGLEETNKLIDILQKQ